MNDENISKEIEVFDFSPKLPSQAVKRTESLTNRIACPFRFPICGSYILICEIEVERLIDEKYFEARKRKLNLCAAEEARENVLVPYWVTLESQSNRIKRDRGILQSTLRRRMPLDYCRNATKSLAQLQSTIVHVTGLPLA